MPNIPINTDHFIDFVRTLQEQEITSRAGRSRFTVAVNGKDMTFIPFSSGRPRLHQHRYVEKILEQFNRTQSYTTSDYGNNGIVNATYHLTLIQVYLDEG